MTLNQDLRYSLRDFCGKYPLLFYSTYGLKPANRQLSISDSTQLAIEGFPRSANSYAVLAFESVNPQVKVAHHLHVPAQILRAAKRQIPALVLVRNPEDAVSSFFLRNPEQSVVRALKNYISFYRAIAPYHQSYVVGKFEDITQNYAKTIEQINLKFHTKFALPELSASDRQKVFQQIKEIDRAAARNNPLKMAVPSTEKQSLKANLFEEIESKHSKLLLEAKDIYRQIIELP